MKILVIRLSSIGDIVLTSPVVRILKTQLNAEVHFLTKINFSSWLSHNPYIDAIHHYEEGTDKLKSLNFDLIVDLHHNMRTLAIKHALKVPSKSVDKLNIKKFLLTTFKWNLMPPIHMVDRNVATIEHLGVKNDMQGLDFFIPDTETLPQEFQIKTSFVAVVIGGQHATKILPTRKLIELCQQLNRPFVLVGGPEDSKRGEEIIKATSLGLNACGKLSLIQSALLVKGAHFVVSHDTGMMHISAALKKKIYSVWGNTTPDFGMAPYLTDPTSVILENKELGCRPCSKIGYTKCPCGHFKCMTEIDLSPIK
ncbi:MAG: glycosyl transferase [Flavobacteriales bacterium]|nr:glycosyl transferase [Flavobacteriales bacterium]|tara:strand:+ start:1828 stop:2757 length:930 start_codon:yes stop_codon:yes gene_type:complete